MEQLPVSPAAKPVSPAAKPEPAPAERMKSAFSRGALGLGALFEIYQMIGTLLLGGSVGFFVVTRILRLMRNGAGFDNPFAVMGDLLTDRGAMRWIILLYAIGMVLGMVVGLVVMRLILTKPVPIEKKRLGFGRFLWVVLIAYGVWGVGAVFGNLPSFFGVEESNGLDKLLEGLTTEALPMYLYVCLGAPLFEELACRKLLLDRLHPYGEGFAALASGLLFGLIHGNSGQFFLAFLLGLLFAMVYLRTGRIGYTIVLHAIINTTASVPELLNVFGIGAPETVARVWNIAVGALIAVGLVVLLVTRKNDLLHPAKADIPHAAQAAWRNVGMILLRVVGLVTLVTTDLALTVFALIGGQGPASLLRLIPMTAALVLVLLLPKYSRRFEAPEAVEEAAGPAQGNAEAEPAQGA